MQNRSWGVATTRCEVAGISHWIATSRTGNAGRGPILSQLLRKLFSHLYFELSYQALSVIGGSADECSIQAKQVTKIPIVSQPILRAAILLASTLFGVASCSAETGPSSAAVLRIEATPCLGQVNQLATAVVVGPTTALTVAHTFDGIKNVQLRSSVGATTQAEVTYVDRDKDIALLSLEPGWLDPSIVPLSFEAPTEDEAVTVISFASPDGPEEKEGQITRLVTATLDGEGRRAAIKLDADIEAGDSGAPVVNESGRVVGMVFATERGTDRGWAIATEELTTALEESEDNVTPSPLGCR